jgi:hypothetical protein
MAAIITNKLRIFNAQEFLQSIGRSAPVWVGGHYYSLGDVVVNNENLFIALVAGTSGAGTGPTPTSLTEDAPIVWKHQGLAVYNNLYMAIAKHTQWVNDANPPTPQDSIGYGYETKAAAIAFKKIYAADMTLAIPRINWQSGRVYTMYEHDAPEEIIPNGYVITETSNQYNVYKCINNQRFVDDATTGIAVASTVKPTTQSYTDFEATSDGYIWKYMYSIKLADALKFLTKDYIPIDTIINMPAGVLNSTAQGVQWQIQTSAALVNNQIENVKVLENETGNGLTGGIGYHSNLNFSNAGSGGASTLSGASVSLSGVPNASLVYVGYHVIDLDTNENFKITAWSVSGDVATATVDIGTSSGFTGTGTNVIVAPGITISGNGSGFTGYGLVSGGNKIKEIVITAAGANWTHVDSATIDTTHIPAYDGSGNPNVNACKIKPIISPHKGHGYDAIEELGGYYCMTSMRLEYDEQTSRLDDLDVNQTRVMFPVTDTQAQFRQIAIVADPQEATTDNPPATEDLYRGPKHPDFAYANESTFDVMTGSGKVLYVENRQPVARAIDQIEDIKVVFEF